MQDGNPGDSFHQSSLNTSRHNSTPKDKKAEEFPGELSIISPTIGNHENSDHGTTNSLETSSRTTEEVSSTPPPALTADPLDISIIPSHSSTFTSLSSPTTILPSQNPSHPLNPIHESSLHTSATPTLPNPPVVQSTPSKTSPTEYTEGSQNFTDSFLPSSSSQDLRELATDSVSKQEMIDFTSVSVQPTMSQPFRGTPGVDTPTNTVDPDPNHSPINGSADDRQGLGYSEATPSSEPWNETSVLPPGFEEGGLGVGGIVGITLACSVLLVAGITIGLALYHRNKSRQLDTTKAQSNHYTGLWDDSVTLSYINNHFDFFQKDVQDEMVSLDNDAYLNSLEFMVFTNTWGDGKRNTRF